MKEESVRNKIHHLAQTHGISSTPSPLEGLAAAITNLSDDTAYSDATDRLLINLVHAHKITDKEFLEFAYAWQIEKRQYREVG